jgi:Na+/H+ antiporter NhaC
MHILYSATACVLAGAVWGDHCSPISDTTVLSSIASGCDHIEHVRTQMPYALLVGSVAIALGTVPAGYGLSPWISIVIGGVFLFGFLRYFGRKSDDVV